MTAPFDIRDVLIWARTKPADEAYDYGEPGRCAIAQFLRETGRAVNPRVGEFGWRDGAMAICGTPLPDRLDALVFADRDSSQWTFGALVKRLALWTDPQTYLDADCGSISDTLARKDRTVLAICEDMMRGRK